MRLKCVEVKHQLAAGPFLVSYPNLALVNWLVGTKQTITWDVAKTDLAPINCKFVNILLSIDGGKSYTITLASKLPNTGCYGEQKQFNMPTSTAKVMVIADDNIFW
ncbi:MAG: hypothetical protein IPO92_11690 [Saprospiraceae bacterium]|nr:hypothetical protein [Saprospiraceae bacterium]